jgi:hypothetical protein
VLPEVRVNSAFLCTGAACPPEALRTPGTLRMRGRHVRMTAVLNPLLAPAYRRRPAAEADAQIQATSSTARSAEPTSRA